MKKIARFYIVAMMSLTIFATAVTVATPAYAACTDQVLGIPTWYRGLGAPNSSGGCDIVMPKAANGDTDTGKLVMTIGLNVVQTGLVLVSYITVFFLIKGGFTYITSAGSTEGMTNAKKTITNAVIGLVISLFSAAIVNAIAGAIK